MAAHTKLLWTSLQISRTLYKYVTKGVGNINKLRCYNIVNVSNTTEKTNVLVLYTIMYLLATKL